MMAKGALPDTRLKESEPAKAPPAVARAGVLFEDARRSIVALR
jgi:hypothetical protein